mgnify:CR=1 FL=1|tara:strand:- start:1750 stop:2448 length:699 start_codon:yes stop_codon:yes gene_type:complete
MIEDNGAPPSAGIKLYLLSLAVLAMFFVFSSNSEAADTPSAIVEDVSGSTKSVQFMDYLIPGKQIEIGAGNRLIIGYLQSCIRESIIGGKVTIGQKQSVVLGGKVTRERVECDGGNLQNMTAKGSGSAVTVFRAKPGAPSNLPRSQITIYGTTPFVSLSTKVSEINVVRLDKKGRPLAVKVQGTVSDFAKLNIQLSPGGLYRLKAGRKSIVFSVDPLAEEKSISLLQRLIQL